MCWKQEWAMAINNIEHAITHIEKAQAKIHNRLLRNEANLQRLKSNKKYNYPSQLEPVQKLATKNQEAEFLCKQIIANLKERQRQLLHMVETFGIARSKNPQRVYKLMGKYMADIRWTK